VWWQVTPERRRRCAAGGSVVRGEPNQQAEPEPGSVVQAGRWCNRTISNREQVVAELRAVQAVVVAAGELQVERSETA